MGTYDITKSPKSHNEILVDLATRRHLAQMGLIRFSPQGIVDESGLLLSLAGLTLGTLG